MIEILYLSTPWKFLGNWSTQIHDKKLIITILSLKSSLWNIKSSNPQLVISEYQVNLTKHQSTLKLVEWIINVQEKILILDGHLVKLMIVNTHTDRCIYILYTQAWGTLGRHNRSKENPCSKNPSTTSSSLGHYIRRNKNRFDAQLNINSKINIGFRGLPKKSIWNTS